ncbi:Hypothetical protein POVR1_LOCUS576 [uncultured virus]|nr:Hypothetical protein POVR1_LOCUS576 [uncultured virus]
MCNADHPDYDEEYDIPSMTLVYLKPYPLEANSIFIELGLNDDVEEIYQWLRTHGFICLGG